MSSLEFVANLEARGAVFALESGEVKVKATKGLLTAQDRANLLAFKTDIAHLLLEREAAALFPGVVVHRADYIKFRYRLLTDIRTQWKTVDDRWHHFWLAISAGLNEPEPLASWCNRLAEERMPSYIAHQEGRFAPSLGAESLFEEAA